MLEACRNFLKSRRFAAVWPLFLWVAPCLLLSSGALTFDFPFLSVSLTV